MFLGELTYPVTDLDGIGPTTARSLNTLGIVNIAQLLRHFPIRYVDRITPVPLNQSSNHRPALTIAEVVAHESIRWKNGTALKVIIQDESDRASMLCFGRNFLASKLPSGRKIQITGPFERNRYGEIQSSTFVFEEYNTAKSSKEFGRILPIYTLVGNLSQKQLRKALETALERYATAVNDELPKMLLKDFSLYSKAMSIRSIHFPCTIADAEKARHTLIFEELLHLQITVAQRKIRTRIRDILPRPWNDQRPQELIENLSFQLTKDQQTALNDIRSDITGSGTMLRLIQGEVGSGKTLVAFLACLGVIGAGRQAAFMAPTELLSRQHADNAAKILEPLGVRVALLTGELSGSRRRRLTEALASGSIDLAVGTHALFSTDVQFKDLALAVIDEQHRFGVDQRRALVRKGLSPDLLALSATPIPRTLALTAFGNMDVSNIQTMPKGRLPIKTHLAHISNAGKVYTFVRKEMASKHRAYFVYPLIEESKKMELKNAEDMYHNLCSTIFSEFKGALLHSRVNEEQKRSVMEEFRNGSLDFLVATSVVEVGVDVPEATCMVVEHAERFGLSALHQLRGRVGRGPDQSYCFLIYAGPLTDEGKDRLKIMKNTLDGFQLAEEDLRMRGPGDFAGLRQSGFSQMNIADPVRDVHIMMQAHSIAKDLIHNDPRLEKSENLPIKELFNRCPPFDEELLRVL